MQELQKNSIDWSTQMSRMTENLSTIQLSQILYDETAQASKPPKLVPPQCRACEHLLRVCMDETPTLQADHAQFEDKLKEVMSRDRHKKKTDAAFHIAL